MITISYPGGSGGNWLKKVILHTPIQSNKVNFHSIHVDTKICIVHQIDSSKFDYLLSGKCYFNFYLNVLYKYFLTEEKIFDQQDYQTCFLQCVNTANHLCSFDSIYKFVYFDFDHLIQQPQQFHQQLVAFQDNHNFSQTTWNDFELKKSIFEQTCVNPKDVYENWGNIFWVAWVLGQLMNKRTIPKDFDIRSKQNQALCRQFAQENYHLCDHLHYHFFDTKVSLPNSLWSMN